MLYNMTQGSRWPIAPAAVLGPGWQARARRLAAAEFDRERIYPPFSDWLETVGAKPPA